MNTLPTRRLIVAVLITISGAMVSCTSEHRTAGLLPSQRGPTISEINSQSTDENMSKVVSFTLGDPDTPLEQLRLSVLCSNPSVVPTNNVIFKGEGAKREAIIQPIPHSVGLNIITIRVSDGFRETKRSFQFWVNPVSEPPEIYPLTPGIEPNPMQ